MVFLFRKVMVITIFASLFSVTACGGGSGGNNSSTNTDTTAPVITLIGDSIITHEAATVYTDAGATANDDTDGDLSNTVAVTGSVDTNTLGSYTLSYNVSDNSGNAATTVTRTVNVVDTTAPTITLADGVEVDHERGSIYLATGTASAYDSLEGNLTSEIRIGNGVDFEVVGSYLVTFNVSDSSGNETTVVRTVNIIDTVGPTVSAVSPADGASTVSLDTVVTATFNEPLQAITVDDASFTLSDGNSNVAATVDFDDINHIATLTPNQDLTPQTLYTAATTTAITDPYGNTATGFQWQFTTAASSLSTPELIETDTGDASYPLVAMDANGNAVAVWKQWDGNNTSLYGNRYDTTTGWGTSELLETMNTFISSVDLDVRMAMNANGEAIVVWPQEVGSWDSIVSNRYLPASGWQGEEVIENLALADFAEPEIAINASGDAIATWYEPFSKDLYANFYRAATQSWEGQAVIVSAAGEPAVAFNDNGHALIAWSNFNSGGTSGIHYDPNSGWSAVTQLSASLSSNALGVQVELDNAGNGWVVFNERLTPSDDFEAYIRKFSINSGWSANESFISANGETTNTPIIKLDDSGNALAVWLQDNPSQASVYSRYYDAVNGWGTIELIETLDVNFNGASRLQLDMNANGDAIAVWAHLDSDSNRNIYYNRFTPTSGWGSDSLIQTTPPGYAEFPFVAINNSGKATVVWQQYDAVSDNQNIYGSRFE